MIQYRKSWQNSARIARAIGNAAVCKPFMRSIFSRLFVERHERAVRFLAKFLEVQDLCVVFPKRMTSHEEKRVDRMNDELFGLYEMVLYGDGMIGNRATISYPLNREYPV